MKSKTATIKSPAELRAISNRVKAGGEAGLKMAEAFLKAGEVREKEHSND